MDADTLLVAIETDLAAAQAEVYRLENFRDYLRKKMLSLNGNQDRQPEMLQAKPAGEESGTAERKPARTPTVTGTLTSRDAAERVLRVFGKPTKHKQIVEKIIADGLVDSQSNLRNFSNTVYSAMLRDETKFRREGKGVWSLTEWSQRPTRSANEDSAKE